MLIPDDAIEFTWHLDRRTYHTSFVITVKKQRSGVKAELIAKLAFGELIRSFYEENVNFLLGHLIFKDQTDSYVIQCGGRVTEWKATRQVLTVKGDGQWELGSSGMVKASTVTSSS